MPAPSMRRCLENDPGILGHLSRSPLTIEDPTRQSDHGDPLYGQPVALVIAHPGHELRVHRWLELARPNVFVLTDGSGRTGHSRIASTSTVLASAQAHPAPIYGRFTDVELYDLILRGDAAALVALMRELAAAFVRDGVGGVVGDALEGFNPSHDLCRFLINGAVLLLRKETGRDVLNFAFPLDGPPDGSGAQAGTSASDSIWTMKRSREKWRRRATTPPCSQRSRPPYLASERRRSQRSGCTRYSTRWRA